MLGILRTMNKSKDMLYLLYESLGHLLLSVILILYLKKDIAKLEKVQRKAEGMTKGKE